MSEVVQAGSPSPSGGWTCPTCGTPNPADFAVCPRDATPRPETTTPTGDPMIGTVLGHTYRILRVLGEGGMARLYEAEHLRVDRRYAIKIIHDDLARMPDLLARFEREARAAGRIRSDHVVSLIDVLRTADGRPCIVSELLQGEDLQARLDRAGKMKSFEAIPIARQICRALADAHAAGVVHRDLKPSNVFLCRDPKATGKLIVKVFDFGLAKVEGDDKLTRTDSVMGTVAYMAPEQARKASDAGPLADIYTAGAVLYHMLTGQPPYGDAPAFSRLALVLHEEPARPRALEPTIPDGVEAVIQHAMARDTAARVQTAELLEAELAAFDETAPATALDELDEDDDEEAIAALDRKRPTSTQSNAIQIAMRARLARPLAAGLAVTSSLLAGAWFAALLGVVAGPGFTGTERFLIALLAVGAMAGVGFIHYRILKPRWNSSTAIMRHAWPVGRAVLAGAATLGALELLAYGAFVVFEAATGPGVRIVVTGLAAFVGLMWKRLRFDQLVNRQR
jgi:serine/threonine-protein kinase